MKANNFPKKAVILAGGKGTRLYPITKEIPKPLLPIKKKPIINYLVDLFYSQGIKNIAVSINKDFREDFDWWKKRYYPSESSKQGPQIIFFEEEKELGTFGGMGFLKEWIGEDLFFFTNGDELKEIDLNKMAEFHQKIGGVATIALVEVSNPQDYGVAVCGKGRIQQFIEKPQSPLSKYINAGLYLFSPKIFDYYQGLKFSMIEKDIFPKLAKEQKLAGFRFQGKWMDTGTWERYNRAISEWT